MDVMGEEDRERCLKLYCMLTESEQMTPDITEMLLASRRYEFFRISLVHKLSRENVHAGKIVAHWRRTPHRKTQPTAAQRDLHENPSIRSFETQERQQQSAKRALDAKSAPAAEFQRKLLTVLACPITKGPVDVLPTVLAADAVREGVIVSRKLDRVVGCIRNFQVNYVRYPGVDDLEDARRISRAPTVPRHETTEAATQFVSAFSSFFEYSGDWRAMGNNLLVTDCISGRSSIHFHCTRPVIIHFQAHPWSAIVEVLLNGEPFEIVDLYEPYTSVPRDVAIAIDARREGNTVEIRSSGAGNSRTIGRQCLFLGCSISDGTQVPIKFEKTAVSGGAEFDGRFNDMLAQVPPSGMVLDVGGGNRQICDSRYINLDHAPYAEPDVIGDALHLPFRDGVMDLVYSSGVFEHLRDPAAAAAEIYRVTKPGGRILIGIAFMQPIHSEGQHFFNCTPWGLQELFKKFDINDISWEGSLGFLVDWMLRATHIDRMVAKEDIDPVLETIKRWDTLITYERLKYIANGVWCVGTKAVETSP
jgi:SAM-dependent methyltransferase